MTSESSPPTLNREASGGNAPGVGHPKHLLTPNGNRLVQVVGIGTLLLLFGWLYLRFAGVLYFVLDDYIETEFALKRSWGQSILDSFNGTINWSGYRPLTYAVRATLSHVLGLEWMGGYFIFSMGLLLVCTLLTYHLVGRVSHSDLWAFVAAAVVLMIPSHNEAVLYMSANANLLALTLSLLVVEASRQAWLPSPKAQSKSRTTWWMAVAAGAYLLAVLAYEVTLPLPLLVGLAQLRLARRPSDDPERPQPVRHTWGLYAGFAVAVCVALAMRYWAASGQLTPGRADYAISLEPLHIAQGYIIFLSQLVLLYSSPWIYLPLFSDLREWMAPTNPRALASMLLAAFGTLITFILAFRNSPKARSRGSSEPAFWLLWGVLWVLMIALPFAALTGRNPENRYTTIPSFGFAVAIAVATAWLAGPLQLRTTRARVRQIAATGVITLLLTCYAYVTTSDVAEWERASAHARAFMTGAAEQMQLVPPGAGIAQIGVPSNIGTAYVYATVESFQSAMRLLYGDVAPIVSTDLWMRNVLATAQGGAIPLVGLGYDRESKQVRILDSAWSCNTQCVAAAFVQPSGIEVGSQWIYAQIFDEGTPEKGGLGMLFSMGPDGVADKQVSCWAFYDTSRIRIDPASFDDQILQRHCAEASDSILASGALRALTIPDAP